MSEKTDYTVKQHFVPQTYLSEFAFDGIHTHVYDKKGEIAFGKSIPINSICYQKDLYELTQDGEYVSRNHFEKYFSKLEALFTIFRDQLIQKISTAKRFNYKVRNFLSENETAFWYFYISLQICRLPIVFNIALDEANKYFKGYSDDFIKNISKIICLPGGETLSSSNEALFLATLNNTAKMNIAVLFDADGGFITADSPVYCHTKDGSFSGLDEMLFAISSNIVLSFSLSDRQNIRNCLVPIKPDNQVQINKSIAYVSDRFIFSKIELDDNTISIIREAWNDKAEDKILNESLV